MAFRIRITALCAAVFLLPALASAEVRMIVFPVDGETSFRDDFLEPRDGGARQHLGNDIIADKMTPVVAAVDGVVSYIPMTEPSYGYMITIQDADGYQYRYLHLNNDTPGTDDGLGGPEHAYAPGLKRGSHVTAGEHIGWVGDSGNAEDTVSHLHFEIRRPDRTAIDPYESLLAAAKPENTVIHTAAVSPQVDVGNAGVEEAAFIFTIDLKEGMQGDAVRELQARLKKEGYFTFYTTTTYFGPITTEAVKAYQRANNIAPTGVANFETRALLNNDGSSGGDLRLEKELFEGMTGEQVTQVQLKLKTLGFFDNDANGIFDAALREAVRRFQVEDGLTPSGYVSFETWNKLNDLYKNAPKTTATVTAPAAQTTGSYTFTASLSVGSRGDEVVRLQCFLQNLGFFPKNIECTGYFGSITKTAVEGFQAARGIESIGIVGPKTRAALNSA